MHLHQLPKFAYIFFHREYEFCVSREICEKLLEASNDIFLKFIYKSW